MMRTVFFDLFDTLVTQEHPDRPAQQVFADRLGIPLDGARAWWKATVRDRMAGLFPTYEETLRQMVTSLGAAVDELVLADICRDRFADKRSYLVDIDVEVLDLLAHLKRTGWTVAIVSNATPDELVFWEDCPIAPMVDDAVFSCRVGAMKPEPEIYLLACERLGVVADEVVFVGDGGFNELPGAAAVGMRPIQARWYRDREVDWDLEVELPGSASLGGLLSLIEREAGK